MAVVSFPMLESQERPVELTESEWQVLKHAMNGLSNAQIAEARGSTIHTVSNQLKSSYQKLGCSSRVEAAAELARRVCEPE